MLSRNTLRTLPASEPAGLVIRSMLGVTFLVDHLAGEIQEWGMNRPAISPVGPS